MAAKIDAELAQPPGLNRPEIVDELDAVISLHLGHPYGHGQVMGGWIKQHAAFRCIEGETGWAVGEPGAGPDSHAANLFEKLENTVLPLFREDRARWMWMMKEAISKLGSRFNSQRMMRRYASEAYLR